MTSTTPGSSLPVRQAGSRHHSHSLSVGSYNSSHRVTRRRSVSSNTANNAVAIAAAAREVGGGAVSAMSVPLSSRRNTMSRAAGAKVGSLSNYPITPSSFPSHRATTSTSSQKLSESAVEDDSNENEEDEFEEDSPNPDFGNTRGRRASEGQYLIKGDGKKSSEAELKCDKCGKGYKHSSCLAKHRWEHRPEWSLTSKLLISKHQQVQLLEAASVLVGMNVDSTPPSSTQDFQSDQEESSASPAASGYSNLQNSRESSAYTTPPPPEMQDDHPNRYSSGSAFSRSYQSAPSTHSAFSSSVPSSVGFTQYRPGSEHSVISPSLTAISTGNKEEDESLANAIGVLSCGFGTPQTRVTTMPVDVPPVPPLPEKFLKYASYAPQYTAATQQNLSGNTEAPITSAYQPWGASSYAASERYHTSDERSQSDVKMEDGDDSVMDDDDYERHSRGRSDEDDEGVFGRMEE